MRLLINLSTLKKGGGQNVGLNFIKSLLRLYGNKDEFSFVFCVVKNTEIDFTLQKINSKFQVIYFPQNPLNRILFEFFYGKKIITRYRIDVIYSYFGYGLFPKGVPQICGSADSNIYYPEVNFWANYKGLKLFWKRIIDAYRIRAVKRVAGVIFENEAMMQRGKCIHKIKNSKFILPSVNFIDFPDNKSFFTQDNRNGTFVGLFFCSWQKNKNYMIIPELLSSFKRKGIHFRIIFTAELDTSKECLSFLKKISDLNLKNEINIVGSIKKEYISELYSKVDFVFLLSQLESFSNNILEAWYFNKVLVVADELWSRSICKNAALYVARNNPEEIVKSIGFLLENKVLYGILVKNGLEQLSTYPNIDERTELEIDYIKKIYESS